MGLDTALLLISFVVVAALAFDFVNGFHDAANSIATIVSTGVLKPRQAVLWASFFNFAALFLFGTGVARTVGSGMVDLGTVTPLVILAGLIGATLWGIITWWFGMPTSSSHALLGSYAGAAMANQAMHHGLAAIFTAILAPGWAKTILFIVLAPILGLVLAQGLMALTGKLFRQAAPVKKNKMFGYFQLASSAFLSLMHGSNDAQKTAGIIAGALVAAGFFKEFTIPGWVLWLSYGTMGLGTLAGGWRIVNTMGRRLTRLQPRSGFSAETSAALSVMIATLLHLPVSTTHTATGAIIGVGAARRLKAVRWKVAQDIFWAWVLTIPAAALMGGTIMAAAALLGA